MGQSGCGREFTGVWDRVVVGVNLLECGTEWLWACIYWSVRQSGCGRAFTGV